MNRVHVKPRGTKQIIRLVFPLAIMMATAAIAHASVRIGGASFSANGQLARDYQYTGSCPVDLKFDWGVISTEPTTVTYSFVRSDGGHSSTAQSIELPNANRSVPIIDEWNLGANTQQFASYSGWVQVNIESPNPISQKINFTIHCLGAGVRIGGSSFSANGQLARDYQYTGSCPVDLKFDWGVIGTQPTTVTYSFIRNDGGHSSTSQSIELPNANRSVPIIDEWNLGANTQQFANYSGWVQISIESPNSISQKIKFVIHCQ
jgi:hypothetical protein